MQNSNVVVENLDIVSPSQPWGGALASCADREDALWGLGGLLGHPPTRGGGTPARLQAATEAEPLPPREGRELFPSQWSGNNWSLKLKSRLICAAVASMHSESVDP